MGEKKKNKRDKKKIFLLITFIAGFMLLLYPIVSNIAHSTSQTGAIIKYNRELKKMNKEQKEKEIEEAKLYNESLKDTEVIVEDPYAEDRETSGKDDNNEAQYISALDVRNIIGNIEIPRIGIEIPIYRGTSELVLQKGVGHLEGTSLPFGGTGTHTALTAHRGLPSSRLFRNLDKMDIGDEFYIHNIEGTIAYKVDNIEIVLPHETEKIAINKDQDYATLITCEPYMVNTHRLLVRGVRTDYIEDVTEKEKVNLFHKYKDFIILGLLIFVSILIVLRKKISQRKE